MKTKVEHLITELSKLALTPDEKGLVARSLNALDARYALSEKIAREPGLEEILLQLVGRIFRAYGSLDKVKGQRILDIACGSNTSKAPSFIYVNTPFGERRISIPSTEGYTAQFEPWFCRILLELEAHPVGVDLGDLDGEAFEHYKVDLGKPGSLNFLSDHSFDAIQDSRLFGSPEFTAQFHHQKDRIDVAKEIWRQEQRLLKTNGILIHSDAANLVQ